ncbi:uncharacterized protein LOC122640183 [Telopea speciosissima]|uniref:uncharacterized protein LOC122640183 n=1 Tax=Telopea speciosissima TaxID=54955 RepID=UPI001CC76046|nr:uncharacterized protein LOC122640183 [Telopea speciosissima]
MIVLFWNIRGVGNKPTQSMEKVDVVAIVEPKIQFSKAARIMRRLGMESVCSNGGENGDRIWVFWKSSCQVRVVKEHVQYVSLECTLHGSHVFMLTFVHAFCMSGEQRQLWTDLLGDVHNSNLPWAIGGDFNAILDPSEKVGGREACSASFEESGNFVNAAGLVDGGFLVNSFTWSNNQCGGGKVVARLDCYFFNGAWTDLFMGDRNTKFFHSMVKVRKLRRGVEKIKDEQGSWLSDPQDISDETVRYLSNMFASQNCQQDEDLLMYIPSLVTVVENEKLMALPSMEEVRAVVFDLSTDSAPGPDGFIGYFLRAARTS